MSFQVGDRVRERLSGREGVTRSPLSTTTRDRCWVEFDYDGEKFRAPVLTEDLEKLPDPPRNPVREAVNRRLAAYYAGERVCP